VTLKDDGEPQRKTKGTFLLTVEGIEEPKDADEALEGNSEEGALTASIIELTMNGVLTIEFSEEVKIEGLSTFGVTLDVEVKDQDGNEIRNATEKVKTIALEGTLLFCQISFSDAKSISSFSTD